MSDRTATTTTPQSAASTSAPAACCGADEAAPCRTCEPAADLPAEMDDSYRAEHHRAMVRELAIAREMSGLPFAPDDDPSELRDDEGPGAYPVVCPSPEDAAFEPTEEDEASYREWCREYESRRMAERIAAGPTFLEKMDALAAAFVDDLDDDIHGLGEFLGELADEARALEAKSWAQFLDRRQAMLDAKL